MVSVTGDSAGNRVKMVSDRGESADCTHYHVSELLVVEVFIYF